MEMQPKEKINVHKMDISPGSPPLKGEITLEFKNIKLKFGEKEILNGVSGNFKPGELIGILGPSGSGKTSLLNVLSGYVSPSCWSGDVLINGKNFDPLNWGSRLAVVDQKDSVIGTSTPRDILNFTSALRLGKHMKEEERNEIVLDLLHQLGIEKCADTICGDAMNDGISGGELKRTCIAKELITNPPCLFLDEPTSGLDSYTAFVTVEKLSKLAHTGRTVMCTIHAPSSELIELFDYFIVMHEGQIACEGRREDLLKFLEIIENPCPSHYNVLDHILFQIQQFSTEEAKRWIDVTQKYNQRQIEFEVDLPIPEFKRDPNSFLTQVYYLGLRELQCLRNNPGLLFAKIFVPMFICLIYSGCFFNVRQTGDIQSIFGTLFTVILSTCFGAVMPMILLFAPERAVFSKEYKQEMYGVLQYFTMKMISEFTMNFIALVPSLTLAYFMLGLEGNFFKFIVYMWLLMEAVIGTVIVLAVSTGDIQLSQQFFPLMFVPQLFFAGLYIKVDQIPPYIREIHWICSLKYGINLILINEFRNDSDPDTNMFVFEMNEINRDHEYIYVAVLIGLIFLFRIIGALVLQRNGRTLISG